MHIAIWGLAMVGLGLWSLAAWVLSMLLGADPSWVGNLKLLLVHVPFGDWLDQWLPGWQGLVSALLDLTQAMLAGLGSAAPWLVGGLWALGAIGIVGVGALLSGLVALMRRASRPVPPSGPGSTAAA